MSVGARGRAVQQRRQITDGVSERRDPVEYLRVRQVDLQRRRHDRILEVVRRALQLRQIVLFLPIHRRRVVMPSASITSAVTYCEHSVREFCSPAVCEGVRKSKVK